MGKAKILKIVHSQLKGLFDSLDKKGNYREEIVNDYHSIISRLKGYLSLNNLDDFKTPSSALVGGLLQLPSPFNERYFNGQIVRAKMRQLLSVIEGELSVMQKKSKDKYPQQPEVTLWSLIRKEIKKVSNIIDDLRRRMEENVWVKVIILIGAISAGIIVLYQLVKVVKLFIM